MSTPPRPAVRSRAHGSATREYRVTARALSQRKKRGERFSMLTAYDYPFARIFDEVGIDVLLVGDSLANVVQGHETTLPVTVDEVLYHTKMVARAARRALVVADMPFGSYHVSLEEAVRSALRFVKEGGAHAVKLEGGSAMVDVIRRIVAAEIPVMGHVGSRRSRSTGWRLSRRAAARPVVRVLDDARAVEEAGAFAVLEGVPADLGTRSARRCRFRRSASAPASAATGRCW